jgi:hypothetical protein
MAAALRLAYVLGSCCRAATPGSTRAGRGGGEAGGGRGGKSRRWNGTRMLARRPRCSQVSTARGAFDHFAGLRCGSGAGFSDNERSVRL